jgi:hypothetical protein
MSSRTRLGRVRRDFGPEEEYVSMSSAQAVPDRYLPPGTTVCYKGLQDGGLEYGVVVHCWLDEEIGGHDRYVAFFGSRQPVGKPASKPYILRYAAASLTIVP